MEQGNTVNLICEKKNMEKDFSRAWFVAMAQWPGNVN